jgi:hypothetical protein
MDYFTVRICGDYTESWSNDTVTLKFATGDTYTMTQQEYSVALIHLKLKIRYDNLDEIIQKKANVTKLKLKDGNSITVNSKYGLRLFKFLNGEDEYGDICQTNTQSLHLRSHFQNPTYQRVSAV